MKDGMLTGTNGINGHKGSRPARINESLNGDNEFVGSKELRNLIDRQQYRCALTGMELEPDIADADHIIPVSRGGDHSIENVQVVHRDVNQAKGTMTNDEFIQLCRKVVTWADRKD